MLCGFSGVASAELKMPPLCKAVACCLLSQGYAAYCTSLVAVGAEEASQRCLLSLRELRESPRWGHKMSLLQQSDSTYGALAKA